MCRTQVETYPLAPWRSAPMKSVVQNFFFVNAFLNYVKVLKDVYKQYSIHFLHSEQVYSLQN